MTNLTRWVSSGLAILLLWTWAPAASASFVLGTNIDTSRTHAIHVSLGTTAGGVDLIDREHVYAGPFQSTRSDAPSSPVFTTYCVNIRKNIGITDHYSVHDGDTTGLDHGGLVAALAGYGGVTTDPLEGEAHQLAIWSAIYNGSHPLNAAGSVFTVSQADLDRTPGLEARADALLTRAEAAAGTHPSAIVYYADGYGQDMVLAVPEPGGQDMVLAVPEPGGLAMFSVGILLTLGYGVTRRRRLLDLKDA